MRGVALLLCVTAGLLAPGRPAAVPGWTSAVQQDYEALLREVRDRRWQHGHSVQPSEAELKLATFSAAMLTRMTGELDHYDDIQRRLQLQQHTVQVNLGRVELDTLLASYKAGGDVTQQELSDAFNKYMAMQKQMASSLGLETVDALWWSPFETTTGSARDQLETMWSQTAPLVSGLTAHLQTLSPPAGKTVESLVLACAAHGDCAELIKMALPYPDISASLTNLLREKHMDAEALARLADEFLVLLGLPAAPAELWQRSQFGAAGSCDAYVDSEKVRVCADGTEAGVRKALALMTDSEYLRLAAGQKPPFQTPAFPGFERAVSGAVALLSLQPSLVQQLVYGYGTGRAGRLTPVSLYLARGGRPADRPDPLCQADIACQQTANGLMEAAVTRLLPLGYHVGSLRWLEASASAAARSFDDQWRAAVGRTLGMPVTAAPADVDAHFYAAGRHAGGALAAFAAFQLRAAACPRGGACLQNDPTAAGRLLRKVMESGSSTVWDALLSLTTGSAPSAAPLLKYFAPLRSLVQPRLPQPAFLKTLELEDEVAERRAVRHSAGAGAAAPAPVALWAGSTDCDAVKDKTAAEMALCNWTDTYEEHKMNFTMTQWEFGMDVSKWNELAMSELTFLERRNVARAGLQPADNVTAWINDQKNTNEAALWGQMFILSEKDAGAASHDNLEKLTNAKAELVSKYVGVGVCPSDNKDCKDEDKLNIWALQAAMAGGELSDDDLKYYWGEYRSAAKSELAGAFTDYVSSGKAAAQDAGLDHYGQFQLQPYGYGDKANQSLLEDLARTWTDKSSAVAGVSLDDMYKALHTYVRHRLDENADQQPIPSEKLGDMFAEDWRNIYNATSPYDNHTVDVTALLLDKNYDIVKMRDDAVGFLKGLGLADLSQNTDFIDESDWTNCTAGKDCEALAWTSGVDDDVRIRMTPQVTMDNYELVHWKAAELQYYLQYMDKDPEYRAPANPAFMDAVAGAISLSVLTPSHLKTAGLDIDIKTINDLYTVDYLYRRALQYLAPLPFAYAAQQWQWNVYSGEFDDGNWERKWWELREDMQGVRPAEKRSKDDADPLAAPALVRDRPGFQRQLSTLLQFQLYEHFCLQAGQYDPQDPTKPLHWCDLTGLKQDKMADMMAAGNTMRWMNVVQQYTVNGTLTADSMIKYFQPLYDYLDEYIATNSLQSGWKSDLDDYWEDDDVDDATVPIVVGVVLGVLVLIVLIAYFVVRVRRGRAE